MGDHGPAGEDGLPGIDGSPGLDGLKGLKGYRGDAGRAILQGLKAKIEYPFFGYINEA